MKQNLSIEDQAIWTINGKEFEVSVQTLTAKDAERLSKADGNRKLNRANVAKIEKAIKNNNYRLNGETIICDEEGNLIDGFHRCQALIQAGEGYTITTFMVRGVKNEEKKFVDIGAARTYNNCFQMEKIENSSDASKLSLRLLQERLHERYKIGVTSSFDGNVDALLEEYYSHPELCQEAIAFSKTICPRIKKMPKTTVQFMYVWLTELGHDKQTIQKFFRQAALLEPEMCKTVRTLVYRLNQEDKKRNIQESEVIIFRAWNAYVEGRELESITFVLPRDNNLELK